MNKRVFVTVQNRKKIPVVLMVSNFQELQFSAALWLSMTNTYSDMDEALENLGKFQLFNDNEVQNNPEESKTDYFKEKSLEKLAKVEELSNFTLEKKEEVKKVIVKRKAVTSSSAEISNTQEEAQPSAKENMVQVGAKRKQREAKAIAQIGIGIEAIVDLEEQGSDYLKESYPPQIPQESKKHKYDQEEDFSEGWAQSKSQASGSINISPKKESHRKRDYKLERKNKTERKKDVDQLAKSVQDMDLSGFKGFNEAIHQLNPKNQNYFQCKEAIDFINSIKDEVYPTQAAFQFQVVDKVNDLFGSENHHVTFNLEKRSKYVYLKCKNGCPFQVWMNYDLSKIQGPPTKLSYHRTTNLNHEFSKH